MTPAEKYLALSRRHPDNAREEELTVIAMQEVWENATPEERRAIDRTYAMELLKERNAREDFEHGD